MSQSGAVVGRKRIVLQDIGAHQKDRAAGGAGDVAERVGACAYARLGYRRIGACPDGVIAMCPDGT